MYSTEFIKQTIHVSPILLMRNIPESVRILLKKLYSFSQECTTFLGLQHASNLTQVPFVQLGLFFQIFFLPIIEFSCFTKICDTDSNCLS